MKPELIEKIIKKFPAIEHFVSFDFNVFLVDKDDYFVFAKYLKEEPDLAFDYLSVLSAVDYPDYLEVVCHIYSYKYRHKVCVKARVSRDKSEISSLVSLWSSANWQEREAWDLFGIKFTGHPNLERLFYPEGDKEIGHPGRKDTPLENNERWLLKDDKTNKDYGMPDQWEH